MSDKLIIRDFETMASIGIMDHEKTSPQPLRINLTITLANTFHAPTDDINEVICYAEIVQTIRDLIAKRHYNLLETLAETIASTLLQNTAIESLMLRLEKPEIFSDIAGVGVEIIRPQKIS